MRTRPCNMGLGWAPAATDKALLQGGFDPSKKSGVGVDFELLVRSLHVRNKRVVRKSSMIFR